MKLFKNYKVPDYEKLIEVNYDEKPNAENDKLAKSPNNINYNCRFPLHVITVDCLLGNPGDAIEQKTIKRKYIENFISFTKKRNCKIVLIFDEIHDAIDNFKPELIPNLWKFKSNDVLHKTFILSATFSEASKIVIKYIAELTNKQLQILETQRVQYQEDKLSNLHLHTGILLPLLSMERGMIGHSRGIFSSGVIDIIQALARVRKKSDIYVIIPKPKELIIPAFRDYNSDAYNYITLLPDIVPKSWTVSEVYCLTGCSSAGPVSSSTSFVR